MKSGSNNGEEESKMIDTIYTHTGKIYVDRERKLEFLTVGDYGKENNIKADFLGLHKEINGVQHHEVDLSDKWVATLSTQKGCPMHCQFCDCPKYGYHGDVSRYEFAYMLETILGNESIDHTKRLNIHYARMGEPTFNKEVLNFTEFDLKHCVSRFIKADIQSQTDDIGGWTKTEEKFTAMIDQKLIFMSQHGK